MPSEGKIILDCDPGEDDALAILLALSKGHDLTALVCGFGNTSAEKTYRNGAGLLTLGQRADIPLFKGAEKPYLPHPLETKTVNADDFVGENGLCGIALPCDEAMISTTLSQSERITAMADHLRRNAPLTYIVTGPCATLAHILDELGTDAATIIRQIIIMGGALDTPGNEGPVNPETGKPYAEFNFYCDPYAVERVLKGGIPVTLVPWDLTERIVLTYDELSSWESTTPQGDFVLALMRGFLESYGNAHARSFEFNDCITITAFEGQGDFRDERIRIVLDGEQAGRIVRDADKGAPAAFFELKSTNIRPVRDDILSNIGLKLI